MLEAETGAGKAVQAETTWEEQHVGASHLGWMEPHGVHKALGGTARSAHNCHVSGCSDTDRPDAVTDWRVAKTSFDHPCEPC